MSLLSEAKSLEDIEWVEAQSTVHIFGMVPNEIRMVNLKDPETRALIDAGMLVVLDDETRALLPPPRRIDGVNVDGSCCGK
jgi:hypothetical protein